jgi:hypothetical protein
VLRSGVRDVIEDVIIAVIRFLRSAKSIRQHASAYVSMRQRTSACVASLRSAKCVSNCTFVLAIASVFEARHHQDAYADVC